MPSNAKQTKVPTEFTTWVLLIGGAVLMTSGLVFLVFWIQALQNMLTEVPGGYRDTVRTQINANARQIIENRKCLDAIIANLGIPTPREE